MEKRLKKLKVIIELDVVGNIEMQENEKKLVMSKLHEKPKRRLNLKPAFIVGISLILLSIIIRSYLLTDLDKQKTANLINTEDLYEYSVLVPIFQSYEISSASVLQRNTGRDLTIAYAKNIGDLMEEESLQDNLLYGPYDAEVNFMVTYSNQPSKPSSTDYSFFQHEGFDGEVFYHIIENDNAHSYALFQVNAGEGVYFLDFALNDDLTFTEAEVLVAEFLSQLSEYKQ